MSTAERAHESESTHGQSIHALARQLWPICRSLSGPGVRETLAIIQAQFPELEIREIPSATQCFDWTVPKEWAIRDAYVIGPSGDRTIDFRKNNLHVVGYSMPVDAEMGLEELQAHLHSLPGQADAIPYVTSYYKEQWGFCLAHRQRQQLGAGRYRVKIDSELTVGKLNFAEAVIPGQTKEEVLLSTYICHPSMANNELSGPCVTTFLAKWLRSLATRRYTYRILFLPETIGSICYVSRNLKQLQARVKAGFVVTCVGDERTYSFLPSRRGDTLADRAALHVLRYSGNEFKRYTYLDRGSDERQYCSPGVDLPVAAIMRSKYGTYPEYHTSLDDLDFVTPAGLEGGYRVLQRAIQVIEADRTPTAAVLCEPQLGKRGLYPVTSTAQSAAEVRNMMNLLAYADGTRTLLEIADHIDTPFWEIEPICSQLESHGLIRSELR